MAKDPKFQRTEKPCIRCGAVLPLSSFYAHPQMGDKHLNKCIECCKRESVLHGRTDKVRAYDSERYQRPDRKKYIAKLNRERAKRNPEKTRARNNLKVAVKAGRVIKLSCEVCGSENTEAHHDDYSKPLDVRWLCRRHHAEHHRTRKDIP